MNSLFQCLPEETCEQIPNNSTTGICKCRREFRSDSDGHCIPIPNQSTTDSDDPALPTPEEVYSHGTSGQYFPRERLEFSFMNY